MKVLNFLQFILLIATSQAAASIQIATNLNNCLNCINSGYDFCSVGAINGTVIPSTGSCCSGMKGYDETCVPTQDACTYMPNLSTRFKKFSYCAKSTQCPKQVGINGYYLSAFNTLSQSIGITKITDFGTCYYVMLNNLDYPVYVNVSSDQPGNLVAYYSPVDNFMKEDQFITPNYTALSINKLTMLPPHQHYQIGVTVLKTGLTYNIEYYRQEIDFSASNSIIIRAIVPIMMVLVSILNYIL
ncbi:UNKNOWN [Stylonychia lemnae]|uniref:Transmembrane protein n=1 Tax=Stylonychia lemnae TaxID=5949 RepID=A0A078B4P7_STYLE|nr:UNKNOWN [Stylonychia lemnae]|eukprot:CDW88488.1 UNKNOWN [Stylonychia lemnae]